MCLCRRVWTGVVFVHSRGEKGVSGVFIAAAGGGPGWQLVGVEGEGLKKQDTGSKHSTWQPRRSLWNGAVARARRQLLAPVLASVRSETLVRRDRAPISKSDRPELALLQP